MFFTTPRKKTLIPWHLNWISLTFWLYVRFWLALHSVPHIANQDSTVSPSVYFALSQISEMCCRHKIQNKHTFTKKIYLADGVLPHSHLCTIQGCTNDKKTFTMHELYGSREWMPHLTPRPRWSNTADSETSLAWKGFLFSLNSCARQIRQPSLGTPYPVSSETYLLMRSAVDFSPHSVFILIGSFGWRKGQKSTWD